MTRVFVYGSLMSGMHNNHLLATAEFERAASTKQPEYAMCSLGSFPGVARCADGVHVYGEVYRVDDLTLKRLDRLESHPEFYKRELVEVSGGLAWMYLLPWDEVEPRGNYGFWVHDGNWRTYVCRNWFNNAEEGQT